MTKTATTIECGCGCGVAADWRRMEYVPRGTRKVLVLPACAEHAEAEFAARDALIALVISLRGLSFWQRWGSAAEVYRLRVASERRMFPDARWRAFRAAVKVCLPK